MGQAMQDVKAARIFSSDNYAVDFFACANSQRILVVTFTEWNSTTLEGTGFGGTFLLKNGFDVIAVKSKRFMWYQDFPEEGIQNLITKIELFNPCRLVTYGSSMGGYAAIFFAKRLSADAAISLSPQFDITKSWDLRWSGYLSDEMKEFSDTDGKCVYTIIFDPFSLDAIDVKEYRKVIRHRNLCLIAVPFTGHPSSRPLQQVGMLKEIVLPGIRGTQRVLAIRDIRQACRTTEAYRMNFTLQNKRRYRPRIASRMIGKLIEEFPLNSEYRRIASEIASDLRDHVTALSQAAMGSALAPTKAIHTMQLAQKLRTCGIPAQAEHYAALAREQEVAARN
jgi:acetyl esterase/lipase